MNRYKFRGKRTDNGEWETGSLVIKRMYTSEASYYIADKMTASHTPVIEETIGQFTGLQDCKGVDVCEGDIVTDRWGSILQLAWDKRGLCFFAATFDDNGEVYEYFNLEGENGIIKDYWAIGNIHDHKDLLNPSDD